MATTDEEAMEGCGGGLQMGEAESPIGAVSVGQEGGGCRVGAFAHDEGRVHGHWESGPRGQGGGHGGRGGGPRPALDCTFSLFFLCGRYLSLVGGDPTMTG